MTRKKQDSKPEISTEITLANSTEIASSAMFNALPDVEVPEMPTGDVGDTYVSTDRKDHTIMNITCNKLKSSFPVKGTRFVIIKSFRYENDYINGRYKAVKLGTGTEASEALMMIKVEGCNWRLVQFSARGAGTEINTRSDLLANAVKKLIENRPDCAIYTGKEYLLNEFSLELEMKTGEYDYVKVKNQLPITATSESIQELIAHMSANMDTIRTILSKIENKIAVR